jgi:hypothetical protein
MKARPDETREGRDVPEAPSATPAEAPPLPAALERLLAVPSAEEPLARAAPQTSSLALAFVLDVNEQRAELDLGGSPATATIAPTLHRAVLETAMRRGEPMIVERRAGGQIVVVGALRTQPTPGIDAMDRIELEADRIHLKASRELTLSSGRLARLALRAAGEVETYASRITSRAEEVHKIIGRLLRLN